MSSPSNPHYNPAWQRLYQSHAAETARLQELCTRLAETEGFGAPQHLAAQARLRESQALAVQALLGQYQTIADYAASRFAALPPPKDGADIVPDFAAFTGIAEVDAAYRRAQQRGAEPALLNAMSLPARQPPGLAAFTPPAAVLSSARRFTPDELGAGAAGETLDCLVSFHEIPGEKLHFCIAHRWGGLSPGTGDKFVIIATILARQAIGFAIPRAGIIFESGRHGMVQYRDLIREVNEMVARLRFYRHLLPRRDLREQFCAVPMAWNGARFFDPDFSSTLFDTIPLALRAAAEGFQDHTAAALPGPQA